MSQKLMSWFQDAVEARPQTLGFILPHMALTFVNGHHPEAYLNNCHGQAARVLAEMQMRGQLQKDDLIVLLGSSRADRVDHTILTHKNGEVIFDPLSSMPGCRYDPAAKKYISEKIGVGEMDERHRISVADFLKGYVSRVSAPRPSGQNI